MKGILINYDQVSEVEVNGLKDMQALVGGYIEFVPIFFDGGYLSGIINEEGKVTGLPINRLATVLYASPEDTINGPMVLLGPVKGEDETELPARTRARLLEIGSNLGGTE